MDDRTVDELSAQVAELEGEVKAQRSAAKKRSRITLGMTAAFCVVLLTMMATDYSRFRSKWTKEKLQAGLEKEMEFLTPSVRRQLDKLGSEVMPVFAAEGKKQMPERWPEVQNMLVAQVDDIRNLVIRHARQTMADTRQRVGNEVQHAVFASYPDLQNDSDRQELKDYFELMTDEAVSRAIGGFYQRFESRLDDTRETLARVDSNKTESDADLQKRFLTLWLNLLQEEIEEL